ncbi:MULTISPECIES: hypothetical protein [Stenotrophomonas]|uniref:hypothetical protein n=1 Tax=Stenotrophomonas TaxID=40323 RepID=UPI0022EA6AF7|nr:MULTISPECIES: hypothetical protein [Stenotrophomonas]MDA3306116.1 hypothetical protein [Stenotrophomonas sp. PI_27]WGS56347.1 hypothetical protein IAI57_15835 [Stenotrophomonas pavanii]
MAKVRLPKRPITLRVLKVVEADLAAINEPKVTKGFWALIQELKDDSRKLEALSGADNSAHGDFFDVVPITVYVKGRPSRPIWRLKSYDLARQGLHFRIIYVYFKATRTAIVLAVAPRDWDYDHNDALGQRITRDSDRLEGSFG